MELDRAPNRTLAVLLTIAVAIYLLERLGSAVAALGNVVLLLALSWLLAFILRPAVEWLHHGVIPRFVVEWVRRRYGDRSADWLARARLPYGLSVGLVYVALLAGLVYGVLALVPVVGDQIAQLSNSIQQIDVTSSFRRIAEWLDNLRQTLVVGFNIDPAQIPLPSSDQLIGQLGGLASSLSQFILDLLTGIVTFLSQVLLVLLISAYIMIDGRALSEQLLRLLPDRFASDARLSLATVDRTFGGFIRGTLLQAFIYGTVVTALMLTFGLQFGVVVGVATGILMLVPVVGGLIGLALPLLAGLLQSSPNTLVLVALLFVFQFILFNLIMPRILSQSLRMPTLLVFVSLIAGGQLLGVWGLVFVVPLAGALYSIGLALMLRGRRKADQQNPDLPEQVSG